MTASSRPPLRLAYGSNGLGDHRLADACALLAHHGYDGIALTLDHHHLDPLGPEALGRAQEVRRLLDAHDLAVVVETGGRFVLDPFAKHHPTLVSGDADVRIDFYRRALDVAVALGSPVLHLWSGRAPEDADPAEVHDRLLRGLDAVVALAAVRGVTLGLEPEPGMVVDTIGAYERVLADLGQPDGLGLTLDIGHCRCLEDEDEATCIRRTASRLVHVQIEDMRRGVHEHLPFGEGEVEVAAAVGALRDVGFEGLVSVELPRHSHTAHTLVGASVRALRDAGASARGEEVA